MFFTFFEPFVLPSCCILCLCSFLVFLCFAFQFLYFFSPFTFSFPAPFHLFFCFFSFLLVLFLFHPSFFQISFPCIALCSAALILYIFLFLSFCVPFLVPMPASFDFFTAPFALLSNAYFIFVCLFVFLWAAFVLFSCCSFCSLAFWFSCFALLFLLSICCFSFIPIRFLSFFLSHVLSLDVVGFFIVSLCFSEFFPWPYSCSLRLCFLSVLFSLITLLFFFSSSHLFTAPLALPSPVSFPFSWFFFFPDHAFALLSSVRKARLLFSSLLSTSFSLHSFELLFFSSFHCVPPPPSSPCPPPSSRAAFTYLTFVLRILHFCLSSADSCNSRRLPLLSSRARCRCGPSSAAQLASRLPPSSPLSSARTRGFSSDGCDIRARQLP